MPPRSEPEWFRLTEAATTEIMSRVADAVSVNAMAPQVQALPTLAHWFLLDGLLLANQANRDGMHANALALTRQCVEAMSIIELGICGHPDAEATLHKWEADELTPGKLRAWLQANVWPRYGTGLWDEPWSDFMREFASAIQPTLFHGLISYILGRVVMATRPDDAEFRQVVERVGVALGKSRYLDGHATNWSQQFWAMVWNRRDGTILE